ncbi:4625_t:CDS:1, partial [Entrophospora sp. SA101]
TVVPDPFKSLGMRFRGDKRLDNITLEFKLTNTFDKSHDGWCSSGLYNKRTKYTSGDATQDLDRAKKSWSIGNFETRDACKRCLKG